MKKAISALFFASVPALAHAVTVEIPAGNIQNGGDVNSVVTQVVYGQANNFTVSGTQQVMSGGSTRNSDIYSYGTQNVLSGGTVYNTLLRSFALQNVTGISIGTTIETRANSNIRSGGKSENTVINGGTLTVSAGATSSGTILNTGRQYVSGTDFNATVNGGTQEIRNGGTASGAKITNGVQQVDSGGTAVNSTVSGDGYLRVYGSIENARAEYDGSIIILGGGDAAGTVIDGGSMDVNENAYSSQTLLSAGSQHVYGVDSQSRVTGGRQIVHDGAWALDTIITENGEQLIYDGGSIRGIQITNGGTQTVRAGGSAVDTKIEGAGSRQNLSGTAENTQILNSGLQIVKNGGIASGSGIWNGGVQQIQAGGRSENAIVTFNGLQYIENGGTALNTTVLSRGIQQITNGGTAENTEIFNYGLQTVENKALALNTSVIGKGILQILSGGTAENTSVENGGSLILNTGGSLNGNTHITDGTLNIFGSNEIPFLTLDNGMVNVAYTGGFSRLYVKELNGNGLFYVNSNLAEGLSDHIVVDASNGNFGLAVHDYSSNGNLPESFMLVNDTENDDDSFYLIGGAVDVGAFHYNLEQQNGDWVLVRTQQLNDTSMIAKNTYASLTSLFYTHLNPLYSHLRIARQNPDIGNGLWVKGLGRRIKFHFKDDSKSQLDAYGAEIGYGQNIWQNNGRFLNLGIYGGYTDTRQKYDLAGKGRGDTYSLGLYASYNTVNGWFTDLVGSYFRHDQKITSYKPDGATVLSKYDTDSWQTSLTVGRRFQLSGAWYVEPSVALDYMSVNGVSYRTNFNTLIDASDADYLSGSIGIAAGRLFTLDNGAKVEPYGRFRLIYDWDGKAVVKVADYTFNENVSSLHYEFGLGFNTALQNGWSAYAEIAARLGSKVDFPWEANFGLQFEF